eukprot:gene17723-24083_t
MNFEGAGCAGSVGIRKQESYVTFNHSQGAVLQIVFDTQRSCVEQQQRLAQQYITLLQRVLLSVPAGEDHDQLESALNDAIRQQAVSVQLLEDAVQQLLVDLKKAQDAASARQDAKMMLPHDHNDHGGASTSASASISDSSDMQTAAFDMLHELLQKTTNLAVEMGKLALRSGGKLSAKKILDEAEEEEPPSKKQQLE